MNSLRRFAFRFVSMLAAVLVTGVANAAAPAPVATVPAPAATRIVLPGLGRDAGRQVTLAAVGDVMLGRTLGAMIEAGDGERIFAGVRERLAAADIAVANLECAVGTGGTPAAKGYTFLAPPGAIDTLSGAGIDVVGLANNHALDYGRETLLGELTLLDGADIAHAGAGRDAATARAPAVITRNGLRVAVLAYVDVPVEYGGFDTRSWEATTTSAGLAWLDIPAMRADIAGARASADIVVVLLHFGFERQAVASDRQVEQARAAIDAGATLVIGAHPHVLQPVERYGNGLIAYSLGNFVFDGEEGDVPSEIFEVTMDESGVIAWEVTPVVVDEDGLPKLP